MARLRPKIGRPTQRTKAGSGSWRGPTPLNYDPDNKNDPHNIAKDLAIKHTIKEIQMLWDKSEGNTQLRDAYRWDRAEKNAGRVKYQSTESCALCPF